MPKDKLLTLSIIIPVYNEQAHLKDCLDAVANQTVKPDEVIVVDNNSTDDTVKIAKSYKFVKIVKEPKQGLIAARNTGFNTAKGDILARIDADARIYKNWVQQAKADFEDTSVAAVTGLATTRTAPYLPYGHTRLWSRIYFLSCESYFGINVLWGANMAIRSSAWSKIKKHACLDDSLVHEDQDLSYLLAQKNMKVFRDNNLNMDTQGQEYFYWPKFEEYMKRTAMTKKLHKNKAGAISNDLKISSAKRLVVIAAMALPSLLFTVVSFVAWLFSRPTAATFYSKK